jgi:RNA polymerase sigma-70 factor, ECF subfamily
MNVESGQRVPSWLDAELAQHRSFLMKLARGQLRDQGLAEDAVQETLVAAWQNQHSFEGRSAVRTWLVSILRYKLIDVLRSQTRQPAALIDHDNDEESDFDILFNSANQWREQPEPWGDFADGPQRQILQNQLMTLLEICVTKLPEQTGRVFLLREYLGFETGEITNHTGLQSGHVRVLLHRARLSLRTCLDNQIRGTTS